MITTRFDIKIKKKESYVLPTACIRCALVSEETEGVFTVKR